MKRVEETHPKRQEVDQRLPGAGEVTADGCGPSLGRDEIFQKYGSQCLHSPVSTRKLWT